MTTKKKPAGECPQCGRPIFWATERAERNPNRMMFDKVVPCYVMLDDNPISDEPYYERARSFVPHIWTCPFSAGKAHSAWQQRAAVSSPA